MESKHMSNNYTFKYKKPPSNLKETEFTCTALNNCCTTENKTMTLDEAIEHCLKNTNNTSCGREHRQLAEWLKELKMYRENLLKGN